MSEEAVSKAGFLSGLSALQKLALVVAAIVSTAGAGMWGVAATTAPDRATATASGQASSAQGENGQGGDGGTAFEPQGFVDNETANDTRGDGESGTAAEATDDKTALELYSPTVFRLGFAFFVGFAIAYALRAAFKVVLIVVGAVLLLLIGLQMAGLITVNWEAMEGLYNSTTAWLATQTESLTAFLSGYLPSGGTAVAGFGMGMLKKQ